MLINFLKQCFKHCSFAGEDLGLRSLLTTSSLGPRPVAPVWVLLTRGGVKWQQWKGADSRSSCKCKCRVICGLNMILDHSLLQLSAENTGGPSQAEMSSLGPLLRCWWHGPAGPVGAAARGRQGRERAKRTCAEGAWCFQAPTAWL